MLHGYHTIEFSPLKKGTKLYQSISMRPASIDFDEPAIMAMTDFKHISPITIEPGASIDDANEKMILCGVRLLFVSQDSDNVNGLITAEDILGEKPVKYLKERPGRRSDISVQDIMTKWENIDVVSLNEVYDISVGDIIETMKQAKKHHILVVDNVYGTSMIRGIFSKTQVGRQVGEEIEFNTRATNFMELEMALSPI